MNRWARLILAAGAFVASAASAFGQSTVLQGGSMTAGHAPMYVQGGGVGQTPVVQDSGPASGATTPGVGLSELLLTMRSVSGGAAPYGGTGSGAYGTNFCSYDAPITNSTGYHYFCLGHGSNVGVMAYGNGGTASALPFYFYINGTPYQFPFTVGGITGPVSSTIGHVATWNNTNGTLLADTSLPTLCGSNPFTSGAAGCVPASGGGTTNFLRADGTFAVPAVGSITVGITTLSGGTDNCILYDFSSVLRCAASSNNSVLVTDAGGTPSLSTTLPSGLNLGTPSSVVLTNGLGLPISTGVAGLGANVAAFLGTPSSANLRAALTDETGTGSAVFGTGATIAPKSVGQVRYASQFGGADWCANLVLADADLGSTPGTIFIDPGQTINACSAGSTIVIAANHYIKVTGGGAYTLNQTIQFGQGSTLDMSGGSYTGTGVTVGGARFVWSGAVSTAMVKYFDARNSALHGAVLDCNSVTGCIGIHMDSDNSPATTQNVFEHFVITKADVGFLIGNSGTSHPTVASCASTPSQSGCYEMDFATIRDFSINGDCSNTAAEGFHINSQNALQQSKIERGSFQCVNIGVHQVFSAGSQTYIRDLVAGSAVGASATLIKTDTGGARGMNLDNLETEGGFITVVDSGCSGFGANYIVWKNLQAAGNATADGCQVVTSISNTGAGTYTVGGTAQVISINDGFTWATSGSGVLLTMPTQSTGTGKMVKDTSPTIKQANLVGTTTNDNAAAGSVGEYVESVVQLASAVALTTGTPINITSISLTAGDWDVRVLGTILPSNTTNMTEFLVSLSTTSATVDTTPGRIASHTDAGTVYNGTSTITNAIPNYRFSLSATTTIYFVARSTFSVSTNKAYGIISARRVR